ncbi:MAG: hypothetical protein AABX47_03710 [Nanoarchaeota archaeon]
MGTIKEFITDKKAPIILTVILLIAGTAVYLGDGGYTITGFSILSQKTQGIQVYDNIRLKAVNTADGIKIVALARNNALARFEASEGLPIPESDTIVVGSDEAAAMRAKRKMSKIGERVEGIPGINPIAGGIIAKTGGPIDNLYLTSDKQFDLVEGEEGRVSIRAGNNSLLKMFYRYRPGKDPEMKVTLKEGDATNYKTYEIAGDKYYPVVLGSDEAEMMRSEGLYNKPGDIQRDFFGKNVVFIGTMEKTGTILDKAHITEAGI